MATATKLTEDHVKLLNEKVLAHVAVVAPDGGPHVTPVWVDTDGEAVLFNTDRGRVKGRALEANPKVAISIVSREDDYRTCIIRGTAELIDEGASEHIDKLAKKYIGKDVYPWHQEGERRVIVRVVPEEILNRG